MSARVIKLCCVLGMLAVCPLLLSCQQQPGNSELSDLTTVVKQLSVQIKGLDEAFKASVDPEEFKKVKKNLAKVEADLDANLDLDKSMDERLGKVPIHIEAAVAKLRQDVNAQDDVLRENDKELLALMLGNKKILAEIAENDPNGKPVVAIRALMNKSDKFHNEFSIAVRESLPSKPQYGTLRVENNMTTGQWLRVNGVSQWVGPLSAVDIFVPIGTATTELVGYEAAKTWWVGPPNYVQRIVINPRQYYSLPVTWYAWAW